MPVRASEIMTENPVTVTEMTSVEEALALLHELDVRHLPVVRGRELTGIVSDRDLRPFRYPDDDDAVVSVERARSTTIGPFMTRHPVTGDPETPVRELIDTMLLHRLSAIPVIDVDTSELLGIVSYIDLLRLLQETLPPT